MFAAPAHRLRADIARDPISVPKLHRRACAVQSRLTLQRVRSKRVADALRQMKLKHHAAELPSLDDRRDGIVPTRPQRILRPCWHRRVRDAPRRRRREHLAYVTRQRARVDGRRAQPAERLHEEHETVRRRVDPALDDVPRGNGIRGAVHFDAPETLGVARQTPFSARQLVGRVKA